METFKQTCDKPYHRHTYEIVLKNDKKVFFDDWDGVQEYWFNHNRIPDYLDVVNVLDKSKRKEQVKPLGFGS